MPIDAKGIYSLETKPCGCRIKRYKGGRTIRIGCASHPSTEKWYECGAMKCGMMFKRKIDLLKHREAHFIT